MTVLSQVDFFHGKFKLLFWRKPAATESHYPTYSACWYTDGYAMHNNKKKTLGDKSTAQTYTQKCQTQSTAETCEKIAYTVSV